MKKLILSALSLFSALGMQAADAPLWLRHCAISPDGKTVAFCYKGDLFTVPSTGGRAAQLTTHTAHDTRPVWSPDGQQIAFASNREGSFDVYVIDRNGGRPRRVTCHSADEYPETFRDDHTILYRADIQQDAADGHFPGSTQVYAVDIREEGSRPTLFSSMTMEEISVNGQGRVLYQDKKGYEDTFRKHHRSPITRDIWLTQADGRRTYRKLTSFKGEDREPVWAADGTSYYYLSEENGSFNVYKGSLEGNAAPRQLTRLANHPVRHLSASRDGVLCFSHDGEIYTMKEDGQPERLDVEIVSDETAKAVEYQTRSWGAGQIKASPDGKEIAFVMGGDVYVTSVEYQTTKRITNTPEQERDIDISPDGRTIIYSSERNGVWGIYRTDIVREDDKQFVYAQELKEEPLIVGKEPCFQASFSPDGKEIAYLANRTEIRVYNLESKKSRTVLEGKYNYSYADGDQEFCWSPDSRWLLAKYISVGGWNNTDIALVKADGSGQTINLTESGYSDSSPRWVLDGKAMTWQSDRAGYRSHGSWGAHSDMYIMFFDAEAYDRFRMSKEDQALYEEKQKAEKEKAEKEKTDKDKGKDAKKKDKGKKEETKDGNKTPAAKPLEFDLENRRNRIIRLTMNSSNLADGILDKDGSKFYYLSAFEGNYDLWVRDLKEGSLRILVKGAGAGYLDQDKECKYIYMSNGSIKRIETANGATKDIAFSAPYDHRPLAQRQYIFGHAWQQVKDKFYVKDLHGVDWDAYRKAYERFLPHINNNYDFADMLSELLGELNASHTGARYSGTGASQPTASLGAFFDDTYKGDGLKVKEIIKRGPLTRANSKIKAGTIITRIDGTPIRKGKDYYPLLAGKAGRKVRLTFTNEGAKDEAEEIVTPISYGALDNLLYERWVDQRKALAEKYSDGQIGYVHVKGMDSESFRRVYSELLGSCRGKKAVVVDTRHNGGGWLHNDLGILLSGREFQQYVPRGQYIGSDPYSRWNKPSAVLICEDNYSNAHGFPFMYKALGLGKLIGAPMAGTMTAVWWERQIDPSIVFGIPQVAIKDMNGNYLENQQLDPDILIYNDPAAELQGEDQQLKAAVQHLLKETK